MGEMGANSRLVQARAQGSSPKGKLGQQLEAQKGKTQGDLLAEGARDNVGHRNADAQAQARNWD